MPTTCDIVAVVKADAYGHGAAPITHALAQSGVTRFGVATLAEGLALRAAGITASILVMGALLPEECPDAIAHGLTPVVYDLHQADCLAACLKDRAMPYSVHLKVDTGMGRLGLSPKTMPDVLAKLRVHRALKLEGIMTHLADADHENADYTQQQVDQFCAILRQIEAEGLAVPLVHAANSAGILRHPASHFTAVRPGIMLYGYHPIRESPAPSSLKPVMSLSTRVVQVRSLDTGQSVSYNRTYTATRPSRIAVLPIGYADGYNRRLSNQAAVLIHGKRAPVVGRVCMDMTMVDVTNIPGVQPGDNAILIGRQGEEHITAQELADLQGTIPYEVLCAIGSRVPRVYQPTPPGS